MKKFILKLFMLIILLLGSFSLSSCSIGMLGDFYFIQDNKIQQQISFKITNNAILTTNKYDDNGVIISANSIKTKWQRASVVKTDEENNPIIDENGSYIYNETINLTYYENDIKKVIQFHLSNGILIDYYYNREYKTYRKFERGK